jgi:hypothetical protein
MNVYRGMTKVMAFLFIFIGVGMVSLTVFRGGGVGILLGSLFIAAGAGRLWLLRRRM